MQLPSKVVNKVSTLRSKAVVTVLLSTKKSLTVLNPKFSAHSIKDMAETVFKQNALKFSLVLEEVLPTTS